LNLAVSTARPAGGGAAADFGKNTAGPKKGDWVVMAAWLVQLCARLLLPADAPASAAEADAFRGQLVALEEIQALAGWLERRPAAASR
jgi:chromatin segregation and condensation protein Rec8/ScpA/Scc1 (kleisin family)